MLRLPLRCGVARELTGFTRGATADAFNTQKPFLPQGGTVTGFIKIYRGWHDSAQFADEPYCERAAWCWLLANAAWKATVQRNHRGEVVRVERGQYRTSLRALAGEWRWSIKRVRTFLSVLEKCGSIGMHGAQSGTVITICKYDEYQSAGHEAGTQEASHGARSGHTKEEYKEVKEEKNIPPKAPRKRWVDCPDGVSQEVWQDWRQHRKTVFTDTALRGLLREADKAGWTAEEAIREAIERGWQGFKADWVKEKSSVRSTSNTNTAQLALEKLGLAGN